MQIDLLRILLVVTAILVVPMLGGAVAGLIADRVARTSPMFTLIGFGIGNLFAIVGIWLLIRGGGRSKGDPDAS
ncbi:MAG: hypothetical protein ABR509_03220 [Candidatus Limnocylindria bacterium]